MKKLIVVIVLGAALLTIASFLFPQEEDESEGKRAYGDPDGDTSEGDVASLVD
ncbi:hypothetical protein IAD21_04903 [Abditibacteriota bacterium]|nr:hypothetical protein IAD21_04903 [Abditibacteriota bacterium]